MVLCSQGVLRIHLAEAQNLIAKDNFMGGMVKGKSDPYVKIKVAGITYRSHTIKENLNPTWNELYEVRGAVRARRRPAGAPLTRDSGPTFTFTFTLWLFSRRFYPQRLATSPNKQQRISVGTVGMFIEPRAQR